jgi:DNA-binding response OmpR family regulator
MAKVLIVEDDESLRDSIVDYLSFDHHSVEPAPTCQDALDKLAISDFDALVLDWELPDGSGVDLLKRYRAKGGTAPILMLTGKNALADKEVGFGAGADDYLTKPFAFKELVMRVNALLRRPQALHGSVLRARDVVLDPHSYRVTVDGADLKLLPREFALLQFLMRNPNTVFSADALLSRVWESEVDASPAAVVACISRLRQKLEKKGDRPFLRNIHGVGYKLEP